MESQNRRRALQGASALVVGALLALGFAAGANADDATPTAPPSTIDPNQQATLNIHKYKQPTDSLGIPDNGAEQDIPASVVPLAGVSFQVQQVPGIDLTTNEGWNTLSTMSITDAQKAVSDVTPITTAPTDPDGLATFAGLDLGAYVVTETSAPAGATPVAPFLVTLPMTDPSSPGSWMYTVNVYPKNSVIDPATKTVDDSKATKVGDNVTWTITGDIPDTKDPDGNVLAPDGYRISDPLDSRLTYVSTEVSLVDASGEAITGVTLSEGDDYKVEQIASTDANGKASTTIQVTFNAPGLAKLGANSSAKVQVVIVTTVNAVGDISNTAITYPNAESFDIDPGQPGGPTESTATDTKFGNVTIQKVSAADTSTAVAGATFEVFASAADADAQTNPISIDGTSSWTTDAKGQLTISGLRQSGWYDGNPVADSSADYQWYWIVETQAPKGYELLANPVKVAVGDVDTAVDYTVDDAPSNGGFQLPFTGSAIGAGLFYGGGSAILLAVALTLVVRARRKNNVEA